MRQTGRKPNARSQPPRHDDSPHHASEPVAALPEPHPGQALTQLRLTPGDFALLRRQGFVSCERRGARQVFKLRFRREGRQVVRRIGSDPAVAAEVRRELEALQVQRRRRREFRRLARLGRQALRDSKRVLAPVLAQDGFYFHGLAVRLRRKPKAPSEILHGANSNKPIHPPSRSRATRRTWAIRDESPCGSKPAVRAPRPNIRTSRREIRALRREIALHRSGRQAKKSRGDTPIRIHPAYARRDSLAGWRRQAVASSSRARRSVPARGRARIVPKSTRGWYAW